MAGASCLGMAGRQSMRRAVQWMDGQRRRGLSQGALHLQREMPSTPHTINAVAPCMRTEQAGAAVPKGAELQLRRPRRRVRASGCRSCAACGQLCACALPADF